MAVVRSLVDGYSLLHNRPELAPGRPRHSGAARGELVRVLARHGNAIHAPISVLDIMIAASANVSVNPASL